jgi:hypothetical protein
MARFPLLVLTAIWFAFSAYAELAREIAAADQVDGPIGRTDQRGLGPVTAIGATVPVGSLGVERNDQIDRVQISAGASN